MDDNTISPHQLKKDIRKDIGGCPYLLLQVPILSEISIVRKSYKTLSLTLHPDKVTGTTEEKERKVALFQRINNAQELLKNRKWKESYDDVVRKYFVFGSNNTETNENHLKWSTYLLGISQPTRDRSQESTEETSKSTGDDSEESPQPTGDNSEESSQSTVDDSEESTAIPFQSSHEIAKQWFIANTKREETRKISNNIVAHTIYDILTERKFFVDFDRNDIDFKEAYEDEVRNILKPKQHIYTNFVDYVNFRMFEYNYHIFPLCVHTTMDLFKTQVWDDVKHQLSKNSYISKWSILREANRDKMNVYNDYDMIEQQSMNPEITFTFPINLDNWHWVNVIRRWFHDKLFFFFTDSGVFSGKTIEKSNTKQIPRKILYFLMDTPLWPVGQKAYWIRLPNVRQLEDECATRMLLHSYIVAISSNPFESLIPLNDIGGPVANTRGRRRTSNPRVGPPLNMLCRKWVHSIITNETWMVTPWMIEVMKKQNLFEDFVNKHEDYIARFCFELECSVDLVVELANIIQIEENIQPNEANPAINVDDESSRVQEKRKNSETAENEGEHVDCRATSDEADPASHIDEASNGMQKKRKHSEATENAENSKTAENEGEPVDCRATSDEEGPASNIDEASNGEQKKTKHTEAAEIVENSNTSTRTTEGNVEKRAISEEYVATPSTTEAEEETQKYGDIIPQSILDDPLVYSFTAKASNGDFFIRISPYQPQGKTYKRFYNCKFVGYKNLDGTIGEIEKNSLIRNIGDVIIGINHIHTKGWRFKKVIDVVRGIVSDEPDVTIEFTFLESQKFLNRLNHQKTANDDDLSIMIIDHADDQPAQNDETTTAAAEEIDTLEQLPITEEHNKEDEQVQQNHTNEPSGTSPTQNDNQYAHHNEQEVSETSTQNDNQHAHHDGPIPEDVNDNDRYLNFATRTYKPIEFKSIMYNSEHKEWRGYYKRGGFTVVCYRWVIIWIGESFARHCIENTNMECTVPKHPAWYRNDKKVYQMLYDDKNKKWYGYFGKYCREEVSEEWVKENFPANYVIFLQMHPNKQKSIVAGNSKENIENSISTGSKPHVFLQKGDATCVFSSLASGFFYLNDILASNRLLKDAKLNLNSIDPIHAATMMLTGDILRYGYKKYKSGDGSLRLFDDISCFPTIARLKASDNSTGHAITTVGLWVFDSNKGEAENLSLDFLDWCCSTDTEKGLFKEVVYAVRFFHNRPRKEWKLCDGCRKRKKCLLAFRQY